LAQSFDQLLLARAFLGIGEAGLAPAAYSLIADMYPPHKRGVAFSIYGQGIYLGAGLAFAAGGGMVAFFDRFKLVDLGFLGAIHGWQIAFFIAAAPGIAVAILIAALREPARGRFSSVESMPQTTATDGGFFAYYWANLRAYIPHNLGYSLFMAQAYALSVWLPSFFVRVHGWSIADIGLTYGLLFMIFAPLGSMLGGALAARYLSSVPDAYFRFSSISFLIMAAATLATVLVPNVFAALVFMSVAVAMIGFPTGLNAASLQMITPARFRGIAAGTFFAFSNLIGLGLGPLTVAAATDYLFHDPKLIGLSLGLMGIVVLPIAAIILWRTRHLFAHTAVETGAGGS
jgi:MFS family permease